MKKLILTLGLVMGTLLISAQSLIIITDINRASKGEKAGIKNITDRIGIGYQVNNNLIVGIQSAAGDDEHDMFFRYLWMEGGYISLKTSNNETNNNMEIGIGFSLNISGNLHLEPNYNMPFSENSSGNREGDFNLGLSYRF